MSRKASEKTHDSEYLLLSSCAKYSRYGTYDGSVEQSGQQRKQSCNVHTFILLFLFILVDCIPEMHRNPLVHQVSVGVPQGLRAVVVDVGQPRDRSAGLALQ